MYQPGGISLVVSDVLPGATTRWAHYLLPGSAALDAGNNDLAVDPQGNPLTADLYGNPRIENGTVDIGAYEYQPD